MKKTYILFLILAIGCADKGLVSSNPLFLKLINSNFTHIYSGTVGGTNSIDYNFFITPQKNYDLKFDSCWTENGAFKLEQQKIKSDILEARGTVFFRNGNEKREDNAAVPVTAPVSYNGKALLRYTANNELHYLVIKEIVELQSVNLP